MPKAVDRDQNFVHQGLGSLMCAGAEKATECIECCDMTMLCFSNQHRCGFKRLCQAGPGRSGPGSIAADISTWICAGPVSLKLASWARFRCPAARMMLAWSGLSCRDVLLATGQASAAPALQAGRHAVLRCAGRGPPLADLLSMGPPPTGVNTPDLAAHLAWAFPEARKVACRLGGARASRSPVADTGNSPLPPSPSSLPSPRLLSTPAPQA